MHAAVKVLLLLLAVVAVSCRTTKDKVIVLNYRADVCQSCFRTFDNYFTTNDLDYIIYVQNPIRKKSFYRAYFKDKLGMQRVPVVLLDGFYPLGKYRVIDFPDSSRFFNHHLRKRFGTFSEMRNCVDSLVRVNSVCL